MKHIQLLFIPVVLLLTSSGAIKNVTGNSRYADASSKYGDKVEKRLSRMTVRDKIGQMFCVRPENLIPGVTEARILEEPMGCAVTNMTPEILGTAKSYPPGAVILFAHNCTSPEQLRSFTAQIKRMKHAPLVCIDEEGGRVSRLANNDAFSLERFESMTSLCNSGREKVREAASYIGDYLSSFGIDINLAPVSDVNSNPDNPIIGVRSFSSNPDSVATMVCSYLSGLESKGVMGCIKHFPGHGDTKTDTHLGYAETLKTWEQMLECEIIPFQSGIAHGVPLIMTAHITAPKVDSSGVPSTMSRTILQDRLRGELGFDGIIITDGMEMGAVSHIFRPDEAAVLAIQAGADMILCPLNYKLAFDGVVKAVNDGLISEERIDESVRRILTLKQLIKKHKNNE